MSSKAYIEYTVQVWQEGKLFVAHAMPLDVTSCGPTAASASQALKEAVELYLVTSAEVGTLAEVLGGIRLQATGPALDQPHLGRTRTAIRPLGSLEWHE